MWNYRNIFFVQRLKKGGGHTVKSRSKKCREHKKFEKH